MKARILESIITWSEMGQQTVQAKEVYFFVFCNRESIRKVMEAFLIQKGRTIDSDGLNIREETF